MQGIAVLALFFFSFFHLRKTPNTRLFRSVNISLFPAFDARRPAWHSTWRSLHIPIDTCPTFCGMLCCYSARWSCFPPGPAKPNFNHPPSHPNQLGRPTFNQALRRRIPPSAYLMGCCGFFCQPKITHSGPVFKANYPIRPLHRGFSKQQPPPPPPTPSLSGHRNGFRGKKHSIQCIGSFALQSTTIN